MTLFRVFVPASTVALAVFETLVTTAAFILATYLWLETDPEDFLLNGFGLFNIALVVATFLIGVYFQNVYAEFRVRSRFLLLQQLLMADGVAFLVQALVSAGNSGLYIPLQIMLYASGMAIGVIFIERLLFDAYVTPHLPVERLLLLGESPLLDDISDHLGKHPHLGLQVAGHIRQLESLQCSSSASGPSLEEQLLPFASKRIVVGTKPGPGHQLSGELLDLRFLGYSIQKAADVYAKIFNREGLGGLNVSRLVYVEEFQPTARDLFFQALRNQLIGGICLIVASPVMLLIAAWLRFSGPVLERRTCCGRNGKPFTLYRFRIRPVIDPANPEPAAGNPGLIGRVIAGTGLYALPQLFNLLRGQMALVGPRPHRSEIVAELTRHIPFYPHRFNVPPGMTGMAQVQGRRVPGLTDSLAELEYDLYYCKYISTTMDIFLIVQAIKNIIFWRAQP